MTTQTFETLQYPLDVPARRGFYPFAKRSLDITASALGILLLSPLLLVTALAIIATSRGGALFSQTRVGKDGVPFRCWKFRSMYADAEARKAALLAENEMAGGVIFKMKKDPRITPVGRIIRKLSIDELPQLFNVLLGDMTLVGPRPPVPQEVAEYTPYQRGRLAVTPGITCIWQVSGRSDIPFPQQVELDLEYIRTRSLWLDISLLLKTVPAVLTARGAC
ncbi:MAG: sugar transferase [Halieaceae bacterium]|jgi:lipopolysaccharide/colanic/teichoic acid biosynthesis glycosyltransferase|nr:sugar transferase [Halieaceae bacterium]